MENIPNTIYSGYNTNIPQAFQLPEAEVVPYGSTSIEKRKIAAITKRYNTIQEHENKLMPGFSLLNTGKKYHASGSSWQIIDPRGFIVRINSTNLEQLMQSCHISNGLIEERCIWVREDSQTKMWLLSENDTKYNTILENTSLMQHKISLSSVEIGDTVFLQNGLTGVYRGYMSLYGNLISLYRDPKNYRPQAILRKHVVDVGLGKYYYSQDPKILKIITKRNSAITLRESADSINDVINNIQTNFCNYASMINSNYTSLSGKIKHVSPSAVQKISLSLEEISYTDAIDFYHDGEIFFEFGNMVLENSKGEYFVVDHPAHKYYIQYQNSLSSFKVCRIKKPKTLFFESIEVLEKRTSWNYQASSTLSTFSLNDFKKYYAVVKHIKESKYI